MEAQNTRYLIPNDKITKAQETLKVIALGGGTLGIRLRTDLVHALEIKRGSLLWVTLEKPPIQSCQHCGTYL